MPHELEGQIHWHEPAGLSPAGLGRYRRPMRAWDRFMAAEGIPVVRAAGVAQLADVPLAAWPRLAAEGAFLQLFGTEGALCCSVLRLPASAGTHAEKHLFEEIVLVLEGRGTTEMWQDGTQQRVLFEWQPGSLFSIPLNAQHRMINAAETPALLLSVTNAPALVNQFGDAAAVFASPQLFQDRFDEETGQAFDDVEPDPVQELALCRTGVVPDSIRCDLPLDNRHSPAYRQLRLQMTGPALECRLGEHRPGRYSRAHLLPGGTVLACLRGSGVMTLWPEHLGPTPWRDGNGDAVQVLEQAPGALSGAGGSVRWFHQLHATGPTPLRHAVFTVPDRPTGPPGGELADALSDDGSAIGYWREDPQVRILHAAWTAEAGGVNRMRAEDYAGPDDL